MDESIYGAVSKKFEQINNGVSQKSATMTQLKDKDRYVYYRHHKDSMWIGLGYWMNSTNEKDYPDLNIIIEIAPKTIARQKIITIFKDVVKNNKNWKGYNLSNPKSWSGIKYTKSLQAFLSEDSQIERIKEYFLDGLNDLELILDKNPDLPRN
jgi:hypothetical protein